MSPGPREWSSVAVAVALVVAWAALAGALLLGWTVPSAVLGIPLTLVVPGWLVTTLLRPDARGLERWALAVGTSMALLTAGVVVASASPEGISVPNLGGSLMVATAVLGALTIRSTSGVRFTLRLAPFWHRLRRPVVWIATGLVVAACLVTALTVSVVTEEDVYAEPFTQLSLVPGGGGLQVQVHNLEGAETSYRMTIDLPGDTPTTRMLTLSDGQTHSAVLRPSTAGQVVVRLFGGSATPMGYRQVTAAVQ
jgi:hypothetical protein